MHCIGGGDGDIGGGGGGVSDSLTLSHRSPSACDLNLTVSHFVPSTAAAVSWPTQRSVVQG